MYLFRGNLVTWCSKKLNVVARLSVEAGYRAMAHTSYKLIWVQSLLTELGIQGFMPIPMYCNNEVPYLLLKILFSMRKPSTLKWTASLLEKLSLAEESTLLSWSLKTSWWISSPSLLPRTVFSLFHGQVGQARYLCPSLEGSVKYEALLFFCLHYLLFLLLFHYSGFISLLLLFLNNNRDTHSTLFVQPTNIIVGLTSTSCKNIQPIIGLKPNVTYLLLMYAYSMKLWERIMLEHRRLG